MKLVQKVAELPEHAVVIAQSSLNTVTGFVLSLLPLPIVDLSDGHGWFDDDDV